MSGESAFVVHRLRAKPVEYTLTISHFVRDGQWVMSVGVNDVSMDHEERAPRRRRSPRRGKLD